ncbi:uncharacterized protein LOC143370000 [Andrena cerasifolii]|uniref:uncharacterized protein LOC143370000 n=1 Tax=Andrena cerasifolii TaxID=2819439 RepID=UPI0040383889
MQGRKFLFEPSNLNRQTPTNLFEKSDFKPLKISNVRTISLPQLKLFDRQQFDGNSNVLATPPMEKKFVPTPRAPVKNKARFRKVDLKPKKLQYSEDELDAHSVPDSGICVRFDQSSDLLPRKQHTVNCKKRDPPQKPTRISRTRLGKIKIQTDDKENDRNVVRNTPNTRNNVAQTSVASNPHAKELSQCDSNLDWKERLRWLQARRDIGLWIECCRKRCGKWRYTEDYHDPSNVPKLWYCDMNSDKSVASCRLQQCPITPDIQMDLIENAYNAGSIVWAHVTGYPWWPGMVSDCPDTFAYYKLAKNSLQPSQYHIIFIQEEKFEYAWLQKKDIKPFMSITYKELIKKTKYHRVDYKGPLIRACELAANAVKLSISERLDKFSYLAQYEKFYGGADNNDANNNNINKTDVAVVENVSEMDISDTSDEIILPSPTSFPNPSRISLKDFYYNVVLPHKQGELDRCSATTNQF